MADQILKEMTHLGSTLAGLATSQLDSVLRELRGDVGSTTATSDGQGGSARINAGTLTFNLVQFASKVGSLLTELSKYDLVRNDLPTLVLNTANPLKSVTIPHDTEYEYDLLIENSGTEEKAIRLVAMLLGPKGGRADLIAKPDSARLAPSERKRIRIHVTRALLKKAGPAKASSSAQDYTARVEVYDAASKPRKTRTAGTASTSTHIGAQVLAIQVLPAPRRP